MGANCRIGDGQWLIVTPHASKHSLAQRQHKASTTKAGCTCARKTKAQFKNKWMNARAQLTALKYMDANGDIHDITPTSGGRPIMRLRMLGRLQGCGG
jgi:hypothetical protein